MSVPNMPERLIALMKGTRAAQNKPEELFLMFFKAALGGATLLDTLFAAAEKIDELDVESYDHLVLGYAVGQEQHQEDLEFLNEINQGRKRSH